MFALTIQVEGYPRVKRALDRLTSAYCADMRPIFKAVHIPWWYRHINMTYMTQGKFLKGKWHQLSERYGEWKEKHYPGMPILQLTGAMKRAMTGHSGHSTREIEKKRMALGVSGIPYIRAHQYGVPKHNLPARPHFGIVKSWMRELDNDMRQWMLETERKIKGNAR